MYHELVKTGALPDGLAADNGVALHFTGTDLLEAVSTHPNERAYRVALVNGEVQETAITPRLLTPAPQ